MKHSLIKLPSDTELIIYLLKEELKNNKLFSALQLAGMEDCCYQSYFGSLILAYCGFDDDSDDLIQFYQNLIDRYTQKVEPENEVITRCALDLYTELMTEKRKRIEGRRAHTHPHG